MSGQITCDMLIAECATFLPSISDSSSTCSQVLGLPNINLIDLS